MTRDDFEERPYPTDDKLVKLSFTKPTPAHENYDVGNIIRVMYIPKTHKVLIFEKITCDDLCQFISYSLYDKRLKVFYFHNILDISSSSSSFSCSLALRGRYSRHTPPPPNLPVPHFLLPSSNHPHILFDDIREPGFQSPFGRFPLTSIYNTFLPT